MGYVGANRINIVCTQLYGPYRATCQNSERLKLHEHECVMHDMHIIADPTTSSNRENPL